ncbi:hypothetical protein [Photobacterium nomapromontoriensis]|uniref:hypothetical protein n=1 Tax=Photobacterium nomapromontoriensis TaxID=2910237 RepID=UPI003D0AAA11
MKMNVNTLIVFIQGILHALINAIYSCVCINNNETLLSSSDKELDELASNYNQLYISVGDLISKKVRHWYGVSCTRWKRNFLTCEAQIRTLLSVLSLIYLYFAKQVSASALVSFYRYAPGKLLVAECSVMASYDREIVKKDLNINQKSSNYREVVAAFFVLSAINSLEGC